MKRLALLLALLTATASAQSLTPIDLEASMRSRGYWKNPDGTWETKASNPLQWSDSELRQFGYRVSKKTGT